MLSQDEARFPLVPTLRATLGVGRVSHLLREEKAAIVVPEGGTGDGRGSAKVSAVSE